MKIAVYAVARNEARNVEAYLASAALADYIVVADTGSTDDTAQKLKKGGALVTPVSIAPWRFDTAFNVALALVPADADICVKLDLDERLAAPSGKTWRSAILEKWVGEVTRLRYWYTWNWLRPGEPGVKFEADNIHGRRGFIWRHPGHTALYSYGSVPTTASSDVEIHHFAVEKDRPDYIELLRDGVRESPCAHTYFYLGRELFFDGRWAEAVNTLRNCLSQPDAKCANQRAEAMRLIGVCEEEQGRVVAAIAWYWQAIALRPCRETYFELVRGLSAAKAWGAAKWAATKCLEFNGRRGLVTHDASAWSDEFYSLAAEAARHDGDLAAAKIFEAANPHKPNG